MNRELLCQNLQQRLADVDVRVDQCDTVRIFWRERLAFARDGDSGIEIRIFLRPAAGTADFIADPYLQDVAFDEQEAAGKLVHWLKQVMTTEIDLPEHWGDSSV